MSLDAPPDGYDPAEDATRSYYAAIEAKRQRGDASRQAFLGGKVSLYAGDCAEIVHGMLSGSVDSVVCDPPYALAFMGHHWDTGEAAFDNGFWREVLRVLRPGGHLLAFSGTRTYHRMAVAIEDAGFEIRDQIGWAFGSGFPKSHDVSKAFDKAAGKAEERGWIEPTGGLAMGTGNTVGKYVGRQLSDVPVTQEARLWHGWGTALKPAWEPICVARKPLDGTVAQTVAANGTGALNIGACRVEAGDGELQSGVHRRAASAGEYWYDGSRGRWPANLAHDGSAEVLALFPDTETRRATVTNRPGNVYGLGAGLPPHTGTYGADESGSAARFFYTAKADDNDRLGSRHPTIKPVDLMRWLCRLVTPPGGLVLDPFAGTGTAGEAAWREGFRAILIEREAEYRKDIAERMRLCLAGPVEKSHAIIRRKGAVDPDPGPLFAVR